MPCSENDGEIKGEEKSEEKEGEGKGDEEGGFELLDKVQVSHVARRHLRGERPEQVSRIPPV